ncbi:HK97-gp10 family putative phage morphogenesis protein [Flavobacterium johnsoniae]|uniref:Phage protein, HK97 gp10 family n=1 Tax=Flavobacterium johnsoniae TaxID=986 RepID=A0A1M5IHI8_FLAJO|nr:HK97-gp10 family putative phage morphogenesis protein [Flavobacterium johnsoniae]SHG27706.1 phage protein, HK97 gp10 family [Flavobacterium johnsoniae]
MSSPLFEVEGFEELKAKIRELSNDKDKKREVLIILRQVAQPTLQAARMFVPVSPKKHKARGKLIEPGNLKKSIGYITGKQENPTIYVGTRAKGANSGWYGHFVERGVNKYKKGFRRKRKRGANDHASIGRTKATPFMAQAYEATANQVTADSERKMAAFIQRRIDKLSR